MVIFSTIYSPTNKFNEHEQNLNQTQHWKKIQNLNRIMEHGPAAVEPSEVVAMARSAFWM